MWSWLGKSSRVADTNRLHARAAAASPELVIVCICTRERPQALARCLPSVLTQQLPPAYSLQVIVVDNSLSVQRGTTSKKWQRETSTTCMSL